MEVSLLSERQIWGTEILKQDDRLEMFKPFHNNQLFNRDHLINAPMSDLAIVLGAEMRGLNENAERVGACWSSSSTRKITKQQKYYSTGVIVQSDGKPGERSLTSRSVGTRPILENSQTASINPSEIRHGEPIKGVQVVTYGEYPQTIAPKHLSQELERALKAGKLEKTGKKYTFDGEKREAKPSSQLSLSTDDPDPNPFKPEAYDEYEYKGTRYIRVEAHPYDQHSVLSDGSKPKEGDACWIEVQPIEWLVEPQESKDAAGTWVARKVLFSGVQFDSKERYSGDFETTHMHSYLQKYFAQDMQVSKAKPHENPPQRQMWALSTGGISGPESGGRF